MAAMGVRRDKAALSSGCKPTRRFAPAGRVRAENALKIGITGNGIAAEFRCGLDHLCELKPRRLQPLLLDRQQPTAVSYCPISSKIEVREMGDYTFRV